MLQGAFRRVLELITNQSSPFGLIVIHATCSGLFGFITACIYGTKTWEIYKYKLNQCGKSNNHTSTNSPSSPTNVEMVASEANVVR